MRRMKKHARTLLLYIFTSLAMFNQVPAYAQTLLIAAGFDIGSEGAPIAQNSAKALSFHFEEDSPEEKNILLVEEDAVWDGINRMILDTAGSMDVILYIAAHGNQKGIFLLDGKGGNEFITYERMIKDLGNADRDMEVFLEACMSGAAIGNLAKLGHEGQGAVITLVTSCMPQERSWACGPGDEKIGLLAIALIDGAGIKKGSVLGSGNHVQHPMASSNRRS